jgi:tetrapyrrole methylase family protein/MazG family protein
VKNNRSARSVFHDLLETMARLRGENGCPWDKEQTHGSLKSSLLEESYELLDALDGGDDIKLREELGDLLHQFIFHCQIASERGAFTAEDVIVELKEKMTRRHPHVFSGTPLTDTNTVLKQWMRLKAEETGEEPSKSALGKLPKTMPALARAQALTERASHVGFDWPDVEAVWQKLEEEMAELKQACSSGEKRRVGEEMGDLLFSMVNLSRFLGVQAEEVLRQAIERFIQRFNYIETELRAAGKTPATSTQKEMDALWSEAKRREEKQKRSL